jgi:hypothetical protein
MAKIDLSKLTGGKFDLQKLVKDVKSMVGAAAPLPLEAKDDPLGYLLSELTKSVKSLQENNAEEAKEIEKLGATLGALYKECAMTIKGTSETPKVEEQKAAKKESEPETKSEKTTEENK